MIAAEGLDHVRDVLIIMSRSFTLGKHKRHRNSLENSPHDRCLGHPWAHSFLQHPKTGYPLVLFTGGKTSSGSQEVDYITARPGPPIDTRIVPGVNGLGMVVP